MKQTISLLHVVLLTVAFLSMGSTTKGGGGKTKCVNTIFRLT